MSQTLASILARVQTVHSFFYELYDLKAEGNKHWNSQKQAKNIFHRIQSFMKKIRAL